MEEIKAQNERKKNYLRQYQETVRRVARIEAEIQEVRAMKMSISVAGNDGMPRGSGQGDLSSYAARLDGLERKLISERYMRIKLYEDIAMQIEKLSNTNEKDVLFYRYIKGLDWYDIADKMNYTERWIHELHGKALISFKLPKEFIEIQ